MAAPPVSGEWKRQFVQQQSARVWGTGVNQVHYYYGSEDLRLSPISQREDEYTPAFQGVPDTIVAHEQWGYQPEDSLYTGMHYDDRPNWTEEPSQFRADTSQIPPWTANGATKNMFRAAFGGAYRVFRGRSQAYSPITYVVPTETVSEGWQNKPQGQPADAVPSSMSQLERQTSMQQRYQTRTNAAALQRATDMPRAGIRSKVTGQRLKVYSGGERHYDMLPKEQNDIPRPFWYRNAGTGRASDMVPNTLWSITPLQRIPPADPAIGVPEDEVTQEYGYTDEDGMYYAQ